jgi:hypothetical protein
MSWSRKKTRNYKKKFSVISGQAHKMWYADLRWVTRNSALNPMFSTGCPQGVGNESEVKKPKKIKRVIGET